MYTDRIKRIELQLVDEKVRKLKQSEPYKEKKMEIILVQQPKQRKIGPMVDADTMLQGATRAKGSLENFFDLMCEQKQN